MAVTFQVDDVSPAEKPLPTLPLRERLGDVLALGGDPEVATVDLGSVHPLMGSRALGLRESPTADLVA